MHFVIDRKKWLRGEGPDRSALLRPGDGKMCCIGQVCKQVGIADETLRDKADVRYDLPLAAKDKFYAASGKEFPVVACYEINDEEGTSDASRERALADMFDRVGHTIEFIN